MDLKRVADGLSVAGQVAASGLLTIKQQGFWAVTCNSSNGDAGLQFAHLPVETGGVLDEDAKAFGAAFASMHRPVIAYCRSGMRSTTLSALSEARKRSLHDTLKLANGASVPRVAGATTT